LVLIFIVGLLMVASASAFNTARMRARDAVRVEDIFVVRHALARYMKGSPVGYPASTGECLEPASGVGAELKAAKALSVLPADPLWPEVAPAQTDGVPDFGQMGFCYFYYSIASDQFKISFFLESNSKVGRAGINTAAQNTMSTSP